MRSLLFRHAHATWRTACIVLAVALTGACPGTATGAATPDTKSSGQPSLTKPSQAGVSQAGSSQAGSSQARPPQARPSQAGSSRARPSQASLPQAGSSQTGSSAKRPAAQGTARSVPHAVKVAASTSEYLARPDVTEYIDTLVAREGFDRAVLLQLFGNARFSATAARLMKPAASSGVQRDWTVYRARFVEPVRLSAGYRFWEDNEALLKRVEREFGVPAEIIVGILGVETVYGRNTGSFRVLDALTTLAFDFPDRTRDRSGFFREQLTQALRLMRDGGADLATLRGSYAGAVGMPQFMPGSIRDYAIDYDGDGRIDLVDSTADIVGSVANFLVRHGWDRRLPTVLPLVASQDIDAVQAVRIDTMVAAGSVPTFAYAELVAAGLTTASAVVEPLALIDLPSGRDPNGRPRVAYLAGTQNFHVITRYNRSYFYAYSVIELGSTIKALRDVR